MGGKRLPAICYARLPQQIRLAPGAFRSAAVYATDRLVNESLWVGHASYGIEWVSVPQSVPLAVRIWAKCWSEWQDLNLRPPRPEHQGGRF
jgi:hypothetical protein